MNPEIFAVYEPSGYTESAFNDSCSKLAIVFDAGVVARIYGKTFKRFDQPL
jgi:hypothetical protein